MTHDELRDRLLDLACGELSPRDAREVEEHAAGCAACGAELAAMRGTRQVMSALPVEPAPEDGARVLVAAAREAVRGRAPRRAGRRWLWAAPLVASLALVVAVSVRVAAPPPPSAAHEDVHALRGEREAAPAAAPPAPPAGAEARAAGPRPAPPAAVAPEAPPAAAASEVAAAPSVAAPPPAAAAAAKVAAPAPAAPRAAPRRAKALAMADEDAALVPSEVRAIAAAASRARRVGVAPEGMTADAHGPTTLEAWRARPGAGAAPAALEGRRFWAVAFTRAGPGGPPVLTVFVEDGTFRPLGEVRAR